MKIKNCLVVTISILMLSGILITAVSANSWPNLPSTLVDLEIMNPLTVDYPFDVQLSSVPEQYDVTDGNYVGWCVDILHYIHRDTVYPVWLHSSLMPPTELENIEWDMINYVLNHKQGTAADVQAAIWYFINGRANFWTEDRTPTTSETAMINEALANGAGYTPSAGGKLAIICLPEDESVQILIIEITMPQGLTPGFWKNHVLLWTGYDESQTFADVFNLTSPITIDLNKKSENLNPTLLAALKAKGGINEEMGIYDALARHAVAALLNAAHPHVCYPMTEEAIKIAVKNTIENGLMNDAELLKNQLEAYNQLGGGIDAHGEPI
jgi:hypothetical protein